MIGITQLYRKTQVCLDCPYHSCFVTIFKSTGDRRNEEPTEPTGINQTEYSHFN
ncbi:MAG: hypothetical protein O9350_20665 [Microcystis sp. LE19-388.1G]|nr:hypothetical protein [Microcystis sp. LE19-388.1G]